MNCGESGESGESLVRGQVESRPKCGESGERSAVWPPFAALWSRFRRTFAGEAIGLELPADQAFAAAGLTFRRFRRFRRNSGVGLHHG